jgi:hypothetical protein
MDDEAIRILVSRLSRQHSSGGEVIERAAILAEGADSAEILEWIAAHNGQPEAQATAVTKGGLHSARLSERGGADSPTPRRYVLPPGVLSP